MRMLRLLLSPNLRALVRQVRAQQEIIDRLEIALRRATLKHNELATDVERLSDRICAIGGRLGGRGNKAAVKPAGEQLDLVEMDPTMRKAALRKMIQDGTLRQEKS